MIGKRRHQALIVLPGHPFTAPTSA
jgi:hypothetical protein